jgi:glycosyltransferase involved in cell wall biosynthesis
VYGRPGATKEVDPARDPRIRTVVTAGFETTAMSTLSFGLTSALHAVKEKPDVALIMNVANGYWLPLLRSAGIPTVVNVDGIEWERAKWGKVAKAAFRAGAAMTARHATALVADAKAIALRWRKEFGRDSVFIPYGADVPPPLPVEKGLEHRGYILVVARFVPENTVEAFFDAAENLKHRHAIVIVGSSGYGGPLDDRARMLAESHPNVTWLGHVSDDSRLHALWQHAGVYFHGHSVGGTNPALVQAMACGSPIVARDTVYNREVLGDHASFVGASADEISAALDGAMATADNYDSTALIDRACTEYSWTDVCQRYDEAISALLNHKRKPSIAVWGGTN